MYKLVNSIRHPLLAIAVFACAYAPNLHALTIANTCGTNDVPNDQRVAVAKAYFPGRSDLIVDAHERGFEKFQRPAILRAHTRLEIGGEKIASGIHMVTLTLLVEADGTVSDALFAKKSKHYSLDAAAKAISRSESPRIP